MKLRTLILLTTIVLTSVSQVDAAQDEMKRLEGTWVPVSIEADGETHPSHAPKVSISDGRWTESSAADSLTVVFKVNPMVTPKQIDFLEEDGEMIPGIYK